ncbi:MAG: 50S ribosomal protein L10 [Breznakia sp.]
MNQTILDSKVALVDEITTKFKDAASAVIVEYRGLSVSEVTELRRELRNEEVDFKVYKNSMVSRAVEKASFDDLKENLTGPNAFAFGADAVAPSRVLVDFAKKHDKLIIKGGMVDGKVVDVEVINRLSKLPNRDGMLSMLLGCFQSPVRSFACVLNAVKEQKEEA